MRSAIVDERDETTPQVLRNLLYNAAAADAPASIASNTPHGFNEGRDTSENDNGGMSSFLSVEYGSTTGMSAVQTSHKTFLKVPETYKVCVKTREAKRDGAAGLEKALKYFTDKIKEVERQVVDSTDIVNFLVTTNDENSMDNYYLGTKTKRIRTAVVKCNFTDSETLLRSVEDNCKEKKVDRIIVSSHATSVQDVIDEVKKKHDHTIILIERLESMDVDVFNRLVALLSYEELNVSLLICICTSRSAFVSHCLMDTDQLLFPKFFPLTSPQDQFEQVAAALIRHTDDKSQVDIFLSGELLLFLKNRFMLGDFSMSELKKIVRLAVVANFLQYDEYADKEDDDFPARLPAYWKWFDTLTDCIEWAYQEMNVTDAPPSPIDLHSNLQRDPTAFWKENKAVAQVRNWLCAKNREELCTVIEMLAEATDSRALADRASQLRAAPSPAAPSTPSATTPTAPSTPSGAAPKMKMADLLKANRQKQAAAQVSGNQLREAVQEVIGVMREALFSWTGHEDYLLDVPEGIEVPDLSRSLPTRADQSLSAAYTALASIDQFKAVPMARWGQMVADRMDNGEFYDRVAQLERMGVVKDMSKQGKKAAMLQHRPMTNFN